MFGLGFQEIAFLVIAGSFCLFVTAIPVAVLLVLRKRKATQAQTASRNPLS